MVILIGFCWVVYPLVAVLENLDNHPEDTLLGGIPTELVLILQSECEYLVRDEIGQIVQSLQLLGNPWLEFGIAHLLLLSVLQSLLIFDDVVLKLVYLEIIV